MATGARAERRIDLDALRVAVSICDVLAAAGIDPPTRGRRMRCPVHAGGNPTACVILDDGRRYHCYACGAHGDVIDLAQALHGLGWRDAVVHVAGLADVDLGTLRAHPAAIARTATIARRRRALRRWREHELTRCVDQIRALTRQAERVGAALARDVDDAATWARLDDIYTRRDRAEVCAAELADTDERGWLAEYTDMGGGQDESHHHAS